MKWVVEYSKTQDQFHISRSQERFNRPVNGYKLLEFFDSEEEANDALDFYYKLNEQYKKYFGKNKVNRKVDG